VEQNRKKQNDKLDLLKCIAIYGVVFLHILLPGKTGVIVNCLARVGVPLFFLSAGYYSWRSDRTTMARRAFRTGKLLVGTCLALTVLGTALAVRGGSGITGYLAGRISLGAAKEFLIYQLLPLPYSWPLWFLGALFLIYCLWWGLTVLLGDKISYDALAVLAAVLLAIHLGLGEVRYLLGGTVNGLLVRNAWLDGIPFFLLGLWMRQHRDWWEQAPAGRLWLGVLVGAALALGERWLTDFMDVHVGTVLMALSLMGVAVNAPEVRSEWLRRTACFCGKSLTFYIFAFHIPIYGIWKEWQGTVPAFAWLMEHPWVTPFAAAIASTLLALALHGLSAKWRQIKEERP